MFNQINHKKKDTNDNWNTSKKTWMDIQFLLSRDKILLEPFFNETSKSHLYLEEMGFKVIQNDLWSNLPSFDRVVTNPPFSLLRQTLSRLFELDASFILLAPLSIMVREYFKEWRDKISILIPDKRVQFEKEGSKERSPFDVVYLVYPMLNERLNYL
jgi:hypothetical protein